MVTVVATWPTTPQITADLAVHTVSPAGIACAACPPGQEPTPGQAGCQPCVRPEDFSSGGACLPCPAGQQASRPVPTHCELCPVGNFSAGGEPCHPCQPGYEPASFTAADGDGGGRPGATECAACPAGKFSEVGGVCASCPAGFGANAIANGCERCAGGMHTTYATDGVTNVGCRVCSAGQFASADGER